jgi:hypothetical protein
VSHTGLVSRQTDQVSDSVISACVLHVHVSMKHTQILTHLFFPILIDSSSVVFVVPGFLDVCMCASNHHFKI